MAGKSLFISFNSLQFGQNVASHVLFEEYEDGLLPVPVSATVVMFPEQERVDFRLV